MLQGYLDQNEGRSSQQTVEEIARQEKETTATCILQCHAVDAIGQNGVQVLAQTALLRRRSV